MSPVSDSSNYAATAQQWLTRHDPFSAWLGVGLEEVRPGYCRLRLPVRPDMLNGFGLVHVGITFAAADTAFFRGLQRPRPPKRGPDRYH